MSQATKKRVLCVEDDADSAFAMAALVECLGCDCQSAATVDEALKLILTNRFDLIILDQELPDGTGLQLCRAIRASNITTPIIIYTAEPKDIDKVVAQEAGAQYYLIKPDHHDKLRPAIMQLLNISDSSVKRPIKRS